MTKLQQLCNEFGQSPWLDNLTRAYLRDGTLARMADERDPGCDRQPHDLRACNRGFVRIRRTVPGTHGSGSNR